MQTLPRFPDQARDDAASDIEPDEQERADEAQRRDGEKDVPTEFLHAPRVGVGAVDLAARGGDQPVGGFAEKRIGVGPKASTGGTYFPEIFKALGIPAVIRNGPWAEIVQRVASGELGGTAVALGPPLVDLAALDVKDALDFLQPSREQFALIKTRFPELSPSLIPSGTYPSLREDYHTLGLYNFAIIHRDIPDDLAYRIVKAVFEHHPELVRIHPAAKETLAANLDRDTFLPLHPGPRAITAKWGSRSRRQSRRPLDASAMQEMVQDAPRFSGGL
jgi:NMT1-like family